MRYHWQKPTRDDLKRGILAWRVQVNSNHPYDVQPCPYRAIHLQRRLARGDDMPDFVQVNHPAHDNTLPDDFFDVNNCNWKQQLNDYKAA